MYQIPVGFQFQVEVSGFSGDDALFQEVGGLSAEVSTEELREGGLNEFTHKLPTGAKYGNLMLKRGFFNDSKLTKWCRKAIENFTFEPKDIKITLLNEENEPMHLFSATKSPDVDHEALEHIMNDLRSPMTHVLKFKHGGKETLPSCHVWKMMDQDMLQESMLWK